MTLLFSFFASLRYAVLSNKADVERAKVEPTANRIACGSERPLSEVQTAMKRAAATKKATRSMIPPATVRANQRAAVLVGCDTRQGHLSEK